MKVTTKVEFELKPFTVPNYVMIEPRVVDHERSLEDKLHLQDIDEMALDRLCNEFRDAVFNKAGKQQPARSREG